MKENTEYIGKVEFSKKSQLLLKEKRVNDSIIGLIRPEVVEVVSPGDPLVIESGKEEDKMIIICSVVKMEINPQHAATNFDSVTSLGTKVQLRPLIQKGPDYQGKLQPTDLSDFQIRRLEPKEYRLLTNLPTSGLPIGKIHVGKYEEICHYPFDPNSETLYDTLYQSFFVAGIQGSGKTNALKYLCQAITSYQKIPKEKRPAVIILDGEKSFNEFPTKDELLPETVDFLNVNKIDDADVQVLTLSEQPDRADATLGIDSLEYNDLVYLLPQLENKTENQLLPVLKEAFEVIDERGEPRTIESIRRTGMEIARQSNLIHFSQIPAIGRALQTIELDMFNQPGKKQIRAGLLFQPGKISVIDIHDLDKSRRRVVALTIQQMLNRYKMENSNKYPGIMLVVDEAEILFPEKPTLREKDYVSRITERMEDITNRGRKRHYGVILVSHLPTEVSSKVVALANSQMAFRCSGAETYLNKVFGKEIAIENEEYPTGTFRLKVNISTREQLPINAKIQMLNMDKCKVEIVNAL
tara:strand:+ start:244 stop:1818 length:1575 start_codon:yes stop_codon:yes gene_type:complete